MAFNGNQMKKIWESNVFGLDNTGDVCVREEQEPKRNFGPIGSKKFQEPPSSIIFSWASDFIQKDGEIVPGTPRGMVPTYPRTQVTQVTTKPVEAFGWYFNNNPINDEQYKASYNNSEQEAMNDFIKNHFQDFWRRRNERSPPTPCRGRVRISPRISENSDGSESSSGYETSMSTSPPMPIISPHRRSAAKDMKEFAERYGVIGDSVRPGLTYRPRTGKYFKKF